MEAVPTSQPMTPTPTAAYKFNLAAGASDSRWYEMGDELVSLFNRQTSTIHVSVKETKSLIENVDLLTAGKAGLAFVYDYHVVLANEGRLMMAFPNAPIEKITIKCGTEIMRPMFPDYGEPARIVLPLYEQPLYIIASDVSGIVSLGDLMGKHVATGEVDSATEQQARFVVSGLGMDWDNDMVHESFDIATAINALKDGEIDALFWSGDDADQKLSGLFASDQHFVLIPIDGTDAQKIMSAEPGVFHKTTIPGGSFTGISDDKDTLAVTVVLATMEDFRAVYVQEILSSIFQGGKQPNVLKNTLPVSPAAAINLLNEEAGKYLHPGLLDQLGQ
jgi:TRAP-type uncharacterized transport system substrate-binding protein